MGKWYRLSLSLANKCRIGFALAVLLLIGGALCLPLIWMDKLAAQGRRELAEAEIDKVLARHFRSTKELDASSQIPPLVSRGKNNRAIGAGRWVEIETEQVSGSSSNSYLVVPAESNQGTEGVGDSSLRQNKELRSAEELDRAVILWRLAVSEADAEQRKRAKAAETISLEGQPGRFERAVWVNRSCLVEGCHIGPSPGQKGEGEQAQARVFQEGEFLGVITVILPVGQVMATLVFNRILILTAGALAAIIAVVAFYLITARLILQPVRSLRAAAEQVTDAAGENKEEGGEPVVMWQEAVNITSTIKTGDEFEQLAEAFQHMLEKLKLAQDRLRETNRALDLQLGELEAKNIALFESNKLKSEFLSNVSHELRTPLNAIIGFAEVLKEQASARSDENEMRYVSNVLNSGKSLLDIINNLLDLATVEAGKVELHWQKCSIAEIAQALINIVRLSAEEKQLQVELTIDEKLGLVEIDPGKFQQIVFNLLSNAIKFTPAGGSLELGVKAMDADWFEVWVSDTGLGIAEEDRDMIFEKFRQLDASVTREHTGTGLGLAIVKELVEVLGGTITVSSESGKGSTFRIVLPTKRRIELESPQILAD